mmetsp:Transcript_16871/g.51975  ORF Transcript_16871/g.51975 Transcript_16871/m.51975 type:complete len:205 (+) Transcript_16871:2028-2642(+)
MAASPVSGRHGPRRVPLALPALAHSFQGLRALALLRRALLELLLAVHARAQPPPEEQQRLVLVAVDGVEVPGRVLRTVPVKVEAVALRGLGHAPLLAAARMRAQVGTLQRLKLALRRVRRIHRGRGRGARGTAPTGAPAATTTFAAKAPATPAALLIPLLFLLLVLVLGLALARAPLLRLTFALAPQGVGHLGFVLGPLRRLCF